MTWDGILIIIAVVITGISDWIWYQKGIKDGRKMEQIEQLERRIKNEQSVRNQEEMMRILSRDTDTSSASESYKRWRDIENHGF